MFNLPEFPSLFVYFVASLLSSWVQTKPREPISIECPTIEWEQDSSGFSCWAHEGANFQYSCERDTFALGNKPNSAFDTRRKYALTLRTLPDEFLLALPGLLKQSPSGLLPPMIRWLTKSSSHPQQKRTPDLYTIEVEKGRRFRLVEQRDNGWSLQHAQGKDEPWTKIGDSLYGGQISLAVSSDRKRLAIAHRSSVSTGSFALMYGSSSLSTTIWVFSSDGSIDREFGVLSKQMNGAKRGGVRAGYPMVFRKSEVGAGLSDNSPLIRQRAIRSLIGGNVSNEQLDEALPLLCDGNQAVRKTAAGLFNRSDLGYVEDKGMKEYLESRSSAVKQLIKASNTALLEETLTVVARNPNELRNTWPAIVELRSSEEYTRNMLLRRSQTQAIAALRRHVPELRQPISRNELISNSSGRVISLTSGGKVVPKTESSELRQEFERAKSLKYTASGKFVAGLIASEERFRVVRVWDAKSGKKKYDILGNEFETSRGKRRSPIMRFWLSTDESILIYVPYGRDESLNAVELSTGKPLWKIKGYDRVFNLVISSESDRVVAQTSYWMHYGDTYECFVFDARSGAVLRGDTLCKGKPSCIGLVEGDEKLVIGQRVYRLREEKPFAELPISPVGKPLALTDGVLWVWNHTQKTLDGFELSSGAKLFELAQSSERRCLTVEAKSENHIRCEYEGGGIAVWSTELRSNEATRHRVDRSSAACVLRAESE